VTGVGGALVGASLGFLWLKTRIPAEILWEMWGALSLGGTLG